MTKKLTDDYADGRALGCAIAWRGDECPYRWRPTQETLLFGRSLPWARGVYDGHHDTRLNFRTGK